MAVLGQLGYRPVLGQCVVCGQPPEAEANVWAPGLGGVVCSRCRPGETLVRRLSAGALDAMRLLQGGDFEEVARLQMPPELADELERHLRDAIHYALEREVRSAAFLQTVRRSAIRSAGRSAGHR